MIGFIWYWTFWHWSKESFRSGALLRSPLQGIGGHWDEWFRHEASESDLQAVEAAGRNEVSQRQFLGWLLLHWAREAGVRGNRLARHFVVGQLAQVQPFNQWKVFEKYRARYGSGGISAIVLIEASAGEPEDVRAIEALALPRDANGPAIVAEGFHTDSIELENPRAATASVLGGKGFWLFLGLWLAKGTRPYPAWLKTILTIGWVAVGGLIVYLLLGPEPGDKLFLLVATLAVLWVALVLVAAVTSVTLGWRAWQQGRRWAEQLEQSQVRVRMNGGLTLKGGSAGLPFCLNTLLALYRTDARAARRSWLWRRLFQALHGESKKWAATGVVTPSGKLKAVVLDAKVRASLYHKSIQHLLTPRQAGASQRIVDQMARLLDTPPRAAVVSPSVPAGVRLGFAAEGAQLTIHPCRHVAEVLMRVGGLTSARQMGLNVLAVLASVVMLLAAHDLRGILRPPPAPAAVTPSSPSPRYLWVSLDTKHPEYFLVVLESNFWLSRRVDVTAHTGANGSIRAEIRLQRSDTPSNKREDDGVVWVERRHRFLTREFAPGERVGRYDFSYLNEIGHE